MRRWGSEGEGFVFIISFGIAIFIIAGIVIYKCLVSS